MIPVWVAIIATLPPIIAVPVSVISSRKPARLRRLLIDDLRIRDMLPADSRGRAAIEESIEVNSAELASITLVPRSRAVVARGYGCAVFLYLAFIVVLFASPHPRGIGGTALEIVLLVVLFALSLLTSAWVIAYSSSVDRLRSRQARAIRLDIRSGYLVLRPFERRTRWIISQRMTYPLGGSPSTNPLSLLFSPHADDAEQGANLFSPPWRTHTSRTKPASDPDTRGSEPEESDEFRL